MKTIFKKALAGVTTTALVASLLVGVNVTKTVKADDTLTLANWSFYEGAASFRNGDDPYAQRFYNSVTTTAGETQGKNFWNPGDNVSAEEMTWNTTKPADGFTADIMTTGWDGDYNVSPRGDNPYLLRAYMNGISASVGHDYTISFTVEWNNAQNAPEKNIMVGVSNAYGESVFKDDPSAVTHIKVNSGSSYTYTQDFTLWAGDTLDVSISYGAFLQQLDNGLTTEGTSAAGILKVSDLKITDKGQNKDYVPDPGDRPTVPSDDETTGNPNKDTNPVVTNPTPSTPTPGVTKTLGKVKKVKAKNNKKGTVKITWKKVANAKSYQIKVGSKKYTSKKASKTVKKLKKGKTYKVRVRAKATGYKTGAWSKKVKVKIKK